MACLAEIREKAKPIKGKSYKKAPEKRSFPGLSERLSCKNVLDQRLLNFKSPVLPLPNIWIFLRFPPDFWLNTAVFSAHEVLIFALVHDAQKTGFAPYVCLAYRCPGQRRTTERKETWLLFSSSPQNPIQTRRTA